MSRTRPNPRISITKLAEYMVANPARRRSIVRDQKYPPTFKAAKFRDAYRAITEVLLSGGGASEVDVHIAALEKSAPKNPFGAECRRLCIDALVAFKKFSLKGAFNGFAFAPGMTKAYVELGGVDVSARPDVLITGSGALKIYLAKTTPLTKDMRSKPGSASYAPAALHLWAETAFGTASHEQCLVADVFAGEVYDAPARHSTRRHDLEAACEEIAARWAHL
jgi:hypothetical protein